MAPQHRRPAARADRSCDAWNGQNAFKVHLTALQKGWKPRGRLFNSFELNFVSGLTEDPKHHHGPLLEWCTQSCVINVSSQSQNGSKLDL